MADHRGRRVNLYILNSDGTFSPWDGSISSVTTISSGQKTVASAGTAEALAGSSTIKAVTIKGLEDNTDTVYVGASNVDSTNGFELGPTEGVSIAIDDPNKIYVDSTVDGEGVSFITVS